MVLFDIETDIEKPPTNKCEHSTSEVWICIEKSKLATNSKSHKSELITNLRFLVKAIKYYDRHFEYGTRFLGFSWLMIIVITPFYIFECNSNISDIFQKFIYNIKQALFGIL